ncbi:MAG: cytochrome c family protein [Spirochaetes bacterium]|nr:cytochrome c family protein [Spirochaetota bacterium]
MVNNFRYAVTIFVIVFLIFSAYYCSRENPQRFLRVTSVNAFVNHTNQKKEQSIEPAITLLRTYVLFNHSQHENAMTCVHCHHKNQNDDRIKTCSWCHQGKNGAKILHALCIACHRKQGGPQKCTGCHHSLNKAIYSDVKKEFANTFRFHKKEHAAHEKAGILCTECHHEAKEGNKKQKCENCHDGIGISKVLHVYCKRCHQSTGGPVHCTGCHTNIDKYYKAIPTTIALEKTGDRLGGVIFNHQEHVESHHTECIDCHHNGSLKKCNACHLKSDKGNIINIKSAFHQQCHDCHSISGGPRNCRGCHVNQRK